MNPVMHPSNVETFLPVFNEVARNFVDMLMKSKEPIDPRHAIFDATLDAVIGTVIARKPLTSQMKKDVSFIIDVGTEIFLERFFKIWLHPEWIFKLVYRKELSEMYRIMDEGVDFINKEWEKEKILRRTYQYDISNPKSPAMNLVDVCYENEDSDVAENHEWKDEITTILLGATDTMVAALSFLLVTLANYPSIQEKIIAEIKQVMGEEYLTRDVTVSDISSLTYLGQAIMESMRFHGNVPLILRKATKDTKLRSCTLPAGSRILIPLHAMGWNSIYFPHPERFQPERFAPESDDRSARHNYSYLPFSGGPRCCIGKTYALMFMKTVMVHILRRCAVKSQVRLEDIVYEIRMVMYSKTPVLLTFEPR
ncbi:cytochrome P450 4c21-like [Homalodisca vitripennis]|uniref:cytochrome P450 4c21-like n=1 Tax=Homalodisca vitripennis TaxID=197043 RepID=UPI001EEAB121|nr:cytochrome P450 4c21-like [Homalodisca vitripennis]